MKTVLKKAIPLTLLLVVASIYSYDKFSKYNPKTLVPLSEVKSAKTSSTHDGKFPFPPDSIVISTTKNANGTQTTLTTPENPKDVQSFYKNILIPEDWILETEGAAAIFYTTTYKRNDDTITITSSSQSGKRETIVSIEIKIVEKLD